MCRLFGVISRNSVDAAYYLKDAPRSLWALSRIDKKRLQRDGWGIGGFSAGKPYVFKSPKPLYRDGARVHQAVSKSKGHILLGHVRWASNPLKLAHNALIGTAHTQPFSHGEWVFVHNGTLYIPNEVKARLGPWAKFVKGRNDSEVLFYWLLKTVIHGKGSGWAPRIRASLRGLEQIWQSCKTRYPIYRHPSHGLNWVLTNGKVLLAFCYVNSNGFDKNKSLASRHQPYFELQMKQTDDSIVVASEPLAQEPGWVPFQHGQLLVAQKNGGTLSTQRIQVI